MVAKIFEVELVHRISIYTLNLNTVMKNASFIAVRVKVSEMKGRRLPH